mmetsp:Transcript_123382/g.383964  ORF Transcript_123382/g.383964 Transcript_123382/m.383964 type:complete len:215 (-) Transcript_123382:75-719(-)|eukprot:CAMPEP_0204603654 /NCGR_PEP_ID=MMETSP0661-20131031/57395_1 /ASSEMBLY_ACC=CAM_ASM_000606 /TAXON_ID=109239 /ORGANISM="Alexandrium margalefi, Strain AMGDE01CS-322" /LENGTH=214 /DNA_ID=CAMNT_0051614735 /DNA_START=80 /DNA_END=724 /DNA_ORIENTATION=-
MPCTTLTVLCHLGILFHCVPLTASAADSGRDALALLQSGLQLSNTQPEYAKPHKHSWEKAKDNLINAGSFVDNFFKKTRKQADDTVNGYLQNASREAARTWRSSLAVLADPSKANISSVSDKISALATRNCSLSEGEALAGTLLYLVDNTQLHADTNGIGYRFTKHISDRDFRSIAKWGSTVPGLEEGDGWLKVGTCFLPMELKGKPVLSRMGL